MAYMKVLQGGKIRQSWTSVAAQARPDGTPVELAAGVLQSYTGGTVPVYLALEEAVLTTSEKADMNTKKIVAGELAAALMGEALVQISGVAGTTIFDTGVTFAEGDLVYAKTGGLLTNVAGSNRLIGNALPGTTATNLVLNFQPQLALA